MFGRILLPVIMPITAAVLLPNTLRAQLTITGGQVTVMFTPDMTKADLEKIQEDVKAHGVELTYDDTDFKGGKLSQIEFSVKTTAGVGRAGGDINAESHFGLRYYRSKGAVASFSVGSLRQPDTGASTGEGK